ncbi:ImmA/IrrE family metallo-endopeptidase [Weissella cibaria]|uniref:ImmA/IrrE family metallo-endopeptidase n=1 Tax=Weissella cibaria TaxID=137591 RepID=UPI00215AD844|nr:ImmA/IrrE family metallo-endopeptidase [Weissella cibaria]MCR8703613.1 ImmA/IrrE family metallo-endopeptidase [Weissella cibaria]
MTISNFKTYKDIFDDEFASQFGEHKDEFLTIEVTNFPEIDVERIAQLINITIQKDKSLTQSGSVEVVGDDILMKINEEEVDYRQRFTIAHEIGHVVSKHLELSKILYRAVGTFNRDIEDKLQERQANDFAAKLLMPDKLIAYHFYDLHLTEADVLAKKFNVSLISMEYRLINLGYM